MKHEWVTKTEQVVKLELSQEEARWLESVLAQHRHRNISGKDEVMLIAFLTALTRLPVGETPR